MFLFFFRYDDLSPITPIGRALASLQSIEENLIFKEISKEIEVNDERKIKK